MQISIRINVSIQTGYSQKTNKFVIKIMDTLKIDEREQKFCVQRGIPFLVTYVSPPYITLHFTIISLYRKMSQIFFLH